ncbi:magnesium/cobalt transporter CorA [Candidatus Woesearchaeota archaeon]|nr:magnesium/cobalt transporter CorA [Candidatus Woesearchaeota archaeon]
MIEILYLEDKIRKAPVKDLNKIKRKPLWIDISGITKKEQELIKNEFNVHPLTAEDLFNQNVRIKVEEFEKYLFCVFYGIQKIRFVELFEIDFILGKNFLITNHKKAIASFEDLKKNGERLKVLFKKGLDFLFHKLLDQEVDNYFPVLEKIDDDIERIEEEITRKPRPELLSKILNIKRTIVYIKKHAFSQREKISFLAKNEHRFLSGKLLPYFRDIHDHAIRVSDSVDNYREAVGNSFDAYMSAVSNSMNEVMKILSIIATIALPLGVISGIYGTNFDVLPGQHIRHGFWLMILLMLAIISIMIFIFKRRRWF